MITWVLIIISAALSIFHTWLWLIAVVLLSLFKLNKWYYYKSKPWRRIHFPAMRYYAAASGTEFAEAQNSNRDFNINNALINVLTMLQPDWDEETKENFIKIVMARNETYVDENLIRSIFQKRNKKLTENDLDELMSTLNTSLNRTDNSWLVRMLIAEIIQSMFGIEERGEYLVACIEGRAK